MHSFKGEERHFLRSGRSWGRSRETRGRGQRHLRGRGRYIQGTMASGNPITPGQTAAINGDSESQNRGSGQIGPAQVSLNSANVASGSQRNQNQNLRLPENGNDEIDLPTYIQGLVTASIGVNRTEDLQVIRREMELNREELKKQMADIVRETLLANTPSARSEYEVRRREPPPTNQPPVSSVPITARMSVAAQQMAQASNLDPGADEFLSRIRNMNLNDDPGEQSQVNLTQGSSTPSNFNSKFYNYHKWGLKYNNENMTVDEFIFRLERLKSCYKSTWDEIVLNFHQFVDGDVATWYWLYLKGNPAVNWPGLRFAIIERFRTLETDGELSRRMYERRQKANESFDDFFTAIQSLNARLLVPKPSHEIMTLLKQNVGRRMGELLLTYRPQGLNEMVYVCRNIERYLNKHEEQKPKSSGFQPIRRNVSEIETTEDFYSPVSQTPATATVEAIREARDTSKYVCWNCRMLGHGYMECPVAQRSLFCYRCGKEGTTSPKCTSVKCSGNSRQSKP